MDSADDKITLFANQTSEQDIFETKYKNIVIVRNASKNNLSSSKIKLKNIVDYSWEVKTYNGRLVAGHKDGKLIAYSIRAKNKGKYEGMIRIVNVENGKRALIKGVYNETIDLEFAYLTEPVLLAYINESTLFIQKIVECNDNLETSLIFQINDVIEHNINHDKVTWCPYIPESTCENDLYASQLVTWSRGTTFQCYSISDVAWKYGPGPHMVCDIQEGGLKFNELKFNILDICFSPDGTTLAASTEDGFVRFYQIYLHSIDGPPRRLHEWKPHDGKAVKKILFLDNLKQNTTDEPLWKNAVTYSEELQEIKLWCCETWNCIQCITFQNIRDIPFHLNIGIDKTASYLILSDMNTQQVYAFCIEKCNLEEKTSFKTVIRFPVSSPILSFDIVYASLQRYKSSLCDTYFGQDIDEYDDETCPVLCILKMFIVQPKSVQECNFLYCPSSTKSLNVETTNTKRSGMHNDQFAEINPVIRKTVQDENIVHDTSVFEINYNSNNRIKEKLSTENISSKSSPSREVEIILNEAACFENLYEEMKSPCKLNIEPLPDNFHTNNKSLNFPDVSKLVSSQDMCDINAKFVTLFDIMKKQSSEMNQIKQIISSIEKDLRNKSQLDSNEMTNDFHTKHITQINQMIQGSNDKLIKSMNETIQNNFQKSLETLLIQIKLFLNTIIENFVKDIRSQLNFQSTGLLKDEKTTCYDSFIREHKINEIVESKLIPAFDHIIKEALSQMKNIFYKGTYEYTQLFGTQAKKITVSTSEVLQIYDKWLKITQQYIGKIEEQLNMQTTIISKDLKSMEIHLSKTLKEQIKIEVQKQFIEHSNAIHKSVLSGEKIQTPTTQHLQNKICGLLEQCQINKAFHLALISNDLSLVEFTLQKANFSSVFNPCRLEQSVLLSLIQQLSADMKNHSEMKQKFLAEAIINLKIDDSSVKEHGPRIMNELRNNCEDFIIENPSNFLSSYVKMLIMASKTIA